MTEENRSEMFDSSTEIGIPMDDAARRSISFHLTRVAAKGADDGDHVAYEQATSLKHRVRGQDGTLVLTEPQWANIYGFLYLADRTTEPVDGKQEAEELAGMVLESLPENVSDKISAYRERFDATVEATEVLEDE